MRIWETMKASGVYTLRGHKSGIISVKMHRGKIYTGALDNTLRIWDIHVSKTHLRSSSVFVKPMQSKIPFGIFDCIGFTKTDDDLL